MWACNAKKSGSGDQTYLRAENERGTAGDETTLTGRGLGLGLGTSLFPVGAMEIKGRTSVHNGIPKN